MTLQVFNRGLKKINVLAETAERHIAMGAQQCSRFACFVIMVYAQWLILIRLFANRAKTFLSGKHGFILSQGDAIFFAQALILVSAIANPAIRFAAQDTPMLSRVWSVVVCGQAWFAHIAQAGRRCSIRPILRNVFYLLTFRALLFSDLRLRIERAPKSVVAIFDLSTLSTTIHQSIFATSIFPKLITRFFNLALTANFGGWYCELSHAVRTPVTNGLVRLNEGANLRLSRFYLTTNQSQSSHFKTLRTDAACRRGTVAISKQGKGALVCLNL